jgi:hypothetical protein
VPRALAALTATRPRPADSPATSDPPKTSSFGSRQHRRVHGPQQLALLPPPLPPPLPGCSVSYAAEHAAAARLRCIICNGTSCSCQAAVHLQNGSTGMRTSEPDGGIGPAGSGACCGVCAAYCPTCRLQTETIGFTSTGFQGFGTQHVSSTRLCPAVRFSLLYPRQMQDLRVSWQCMHHAAQAGWCCLRHVHRGTTTHRGQPSFHMAAAARQQVVPRTLRPAKCRTHLCSGRP